MGEVVSMNSPAKPKTSAIKKQMHQLEITQLKKENASLRTALDELKSDPQGAVKPVLDQIESVVQINNRLTAFIATLIDQTPDRKVSVQRFQMESYKGKRLALSYEISQDLQTVTFTYEVEQ